MRKENWNQFVEIRTAWRQGKKINKAREVFSEDN